MPKRFLSILPWQWLKHYPRYLAAISYRLDKLRGAAGRDHENQETVSRLWDRWLDALEESQRTPTMQTSSEFRWMIEELRVSLFAQPLGTCRKVSAKRCEKLLP
jgi:ATP-dependent helicase HrpA